MILILDGMIVIIINKSNNNKIREIILWIKILTQFNNKVVIIKWVIKGSNLLNKIISIIAIICFNKINSKWIITWINLINKVMFKVILICNNKVVQLITSNSKIIIIIMY